MISKTFIALFSFLIAISDVLGDLVAPLPQNKAVLKGTTGVAAFKCSSTKSFQLISWSFMSGFENKSESVATSAYVTDSNTYEVTESANHVSTLRIKTVSESLAGTYICSEGVVGPVSAQLIVYDSDPACTSNVSSDTHLYQGQSVQMSCSFSYTANSAYVSVKMVWSEVSSSSPVVSTPVITTTGTLTTAVSTITQIVEYSSPFPVYQCKTSFIVTGNSATNDPGYSNTAKPFPSPINVSYFNPNCSIKGTYPGNNIYLGTTVSCQADAKPPPSYQWRSDKNETVSDTATVQISKYGEYTCAAMNNVSRCQLSFNFTNENGNDTSLIAACIGGTASFVILILIILCVFCQNKTKNGDREPENIAAYEPFSARLSTASPFEIYCELRSVGHEDPGTNQISDYCNFDPKANKIPDYYNFKAE